MVNAGPSGLDDWLGIEIHLEGRPNPMSSVKAPKGRIRKAQGNALGTMRKQKPTPPPTPALKGLVFQRNTHSVSQACGPDRHPPAFQAGMAGNPQSNVPYPGDSHHPFAEISAITASATDHVLAGPP